MPTTHANEPRRTLLLTGASRGIGHATVKRFSAAGWRVITCSRHPFPENCPWEMGPEDHIQVDLAGQVEPLAHRPGGGEEPVDLDELERSGAGPATHRIGSATAGRSAHSSRRLRFRILPDMLRGNGSSRTIRYRGSL